MTPKPCPHCGTKQLPREAEFRDDNHYCRQCGEQIIYTQPLGQPNRWRWVTLTAAAGDRRGGIGSR